MGYKVKKILFIIFVFSQFLSYPQIKWEPINSPKGGKITYLEVSNSGLYFAGLQGDYIYVSSDSGKSWERTSLTSSYFNQIKADKDGNVFALADMATTQAGVFIYEPVTRYWRLINNGTPSVGARQITIAPNGDLFLATTGGVYKSTDKGLNWSLSGLNGKFVRVIQVNNNGVLYAGIDWGGIYKSTDYGSTWFKSGDIPNTHYPLMHIAEDGTIFIVLYHDIPWIPRGIYRSTDGGNTWQRKDNGIIYLNIASMISIRTGTLVCAGPFGIFYRTTNNGETWEVTTRLPTASPISSICRLPDKSLLVGSNGIGLIKGNEEGKNFKILENNFKKMGIRSLVTFNNNEMIAISVHDVFKTTDGGLNWKASSMGLVYRDKTNLFRTKSGRLFVTTLGNGTFQSTDNGISWSSVNINTAGTLDKPIIQKGNGVIFAKAVNADGLVKSTDNGNTWTYLKAQFYNVVSALAAGPEGNIYVSSLGTFSKSIDDGYSWQIKEHLSTYTTAMKTFDNYIFLVSKYGILSISEDKGETWTEKDISNRAIQDLTITKDGTLLIAIPGIGIKMSTDKGQSWTTVNDGISDLNVKSFYNDGNDKIYLCTGKYLSNGSGIYLLNLNTTGIKSVNTIPKNYYLEQNYPNPFNPETAISYELPTLSFVTLKIYDLLGKEVATLVNEEKPAGTYKVNFDASGLPSGIYFYRISAGSFHQTKKMVLLK